jgi:Fe-S protein assembly co-chaperone HscB
MTDHFATLSVERRPWLDLESLRARYLALSSQTHPDQAHSESLANQRLAQNQSVALNASYECLRHPKERLRHLLELENGKKLEEVQAISPGLAGAMMQVGQLCQEADTIIRKRQAEASALLKAVMFSEAQETHAKLAGMLQTLSLWLEKLENELQSLDGAWQACEPAGRKAMLPALESLFREFSYADKWRGQVQEKSLQLLL